MDAIEKDVDQRAIDFISPSWKVVQTRSGTLVGISNTGLVANPNDGVLYKTYTDERSGYQYVYIRKNDLLEIEHIHWLVAKAFVHNDDPDNKTEVNHLNGNKSDNYYKNLEWSTHIENMKHAVEHRLIPAGKRGEDSIHHKYCESQIRAICEMLESHPALSYAKIGKQLNVPESLVRDIHDKKSWTHISDEYKFGDRHAYARGTNHGMNIYSEDQIRNVCRLLSDPNKSFASIAKETGVNRHTVEAIWHRKAWNTISSDYEF